MGKKCEAMSNKVYINSVAHISMQQPLSREWMQNPVVPTAPCTPAIDPEFRQWLNPLRSRRWGKILKRAVVTSTRALGDAGIAVPDAVISGTGRGCMADTESFIQALVVEGETANQPTHFMQSTHNTTGSLIAIYTHCHGYNATYSHNGHSFDWALLDAFMQLERGSVSNTLVSCNDELTPAASRILLQAGLAGRPGQTTMSEGSVSMVVSRNACNALCRIESIELYHDTPIADKVGSPDVVWTGTNGIDTQQYDFLKRLGVPIMSYKSIFGDSDTASAFGTMAAACMLQHQHMGSALVVNIEGKNASLIRLAR